MAEYAPGHIVIKTTLDTTEALKQGGNLGNELEKAIEGGSSNEISQGMKALDSASKSATMSVDKTGQELKEVRNESEEAGKKGKKSGEDIAKSFKGATNEAQSLMRAIKGVMIGYTGKKLADYFIFSNADIESANKSLTVLLGSAEKAASVMQDLQDFKFMDIGSSLPIATRLAGAGVESDKLKDKLQQLGDIAGGNTEILDRISVAYSQMVSKGKVSAEDMMQISEAGVNMWGLLAESMGKTVAEAQEMSSRGQLGINDLNRALEHATSQGGKYFGMLEAQSDTLNGKISIIKNEINAFGREAGETAFGALNQYLGELIEQMEEAKNDGSLAEWAKDIGDAITGLVKTIITLVKFVVWAKDAVGGFVVAFIAFKSALAIGNLIAGVVAMVRSLTDATKRATQAQAIYNATAAANPYVLLAAAIAAVVGGLTAFAIGAGNSSNEMKDLNAETKTFIDRAGGVRDLANEYSGLSQKVSKTADDYQRLIDLDRQLLEIAEGKISASDLEKMSVEEKARAFANLAEEARKAAEETAKATLKKADKDLGSRNFELLSNSYSPLIMENKGAWSTKEVKEYTKAIDDSNTSNKERYESLQKLYSLLGEYGEQETEVAKEIHDALERLKGKYENVIDAENNLLYTSPEYIASQEKKAETARKQADEEKLLAEQQGKSVRAMEELQESYSKAVSAVTDLSSAVEEYNENGSISWKTAQGLIDAGHSSAISFDQSTGAIRLNIDALKELSKTQIETERIQLESQLAMRESTMVTARVAMTLGRGVTDFDFSKEIKEIKELEARINSLKSLESSIGKGDFGGNSNKTFSKSSSNKKTAAQTASENYQKELTYQKWRLDMGYISEKQYLDKLVSLRKKHSKMEAEDFRHSQLEEKQLRDKLQSDKKRQDEERAAESARKAEEAKQKRLDSYTQESNKQKYLLDLGAISKQEYYKRIGNARKKYLKEGEDQWRASYLESFNYIKATADEQTKSILEGMEKVVSARDGAMQKMVDNAALYTKEAITIPETTAEKGLWKITTHEHQKDGMNTDNSRLREAIAQNATYEALRKKLIEKKANSYILETFDSLSVDDAILYAESVLSKSSAEWNEYNQLAGQVKSDSQARATRMYQSDVDNLKQGFADKVNATFKGLSGDMAMHGQTLVKSLVEGWNEEWAKSGFSSSIALADVLKGGKLSTAPDSANLKAQQAKVAPEVTISAAPVTINNKTTIELTAYGKVLAQMTIDELENLSKQTGIQFLLGK